MSTPACLLVARDKTRSARDRATAYAYAGLDEFHAHQNDVAMDDFRRALALDANSDATYMARANVEFTTGAYDAAISDARKAVDLKPNDYADAYLLLGTLADRNGDHDARIAYMDKAIALAPNYAEAYAGRAHGFMDEKKYDQALADFNQAISLKPELAPILRANYPVIYIERAKDLMTAGKYQPAIEDLQRALQVDPENLRALCDLGDAYNMTHQYDKASAILTDEIRANPTYPFAYSNRGITYLNTGKYQLALTDVIGTCKLIHRRH